MSSSSPNAAVGTDAQAASAQTTSTQSQKDVKVSHGRGGIANIGKDDNVYADGGIVREGVVGDQGDGAYSTGRGGQANIGQPKMKATEATDQEVIPETAMRDDRHEIFHVGRGGEGNLHHQDSRADSSDRKAAHKKRHHKSGDDGSRQASTSSEAPIEASNSPTAGSKKSKNRWSLFGKKSHADGANSEGHASNKAEGDENTASKLESQGKHSPPSHNGLGDKLKYAIFGKLYD